MMKEKQRDMMVELLRFVFCMLIVLFHLQQRTQIGGFFAHGNIGASWFFLLSGRFMAAHAEKKDFATESIGISSYKYVCGKVKSFMVPFVLCWGMSFVFCNYTQRSSIMALCKNFINSFPEIFQLQMTGMKGFGYVGQSWYLSAMVLTIMICYPLLLKLRENYYYTVAPIVAFFTMGVISSQTGMFGNVLTVLGIFTKGLLWAMAVMNLGIFSYGIEKRLLHIPFTKCGRNWMKVFGLISICMVLGYAILPIENSNYDFSITLILAIGFLILFGTRRKRNDFLGGGQNNCQVVFQSVYLFGQVKLIHLSDSYSRHRLFQRYSFTLEM